MNLVILEPADFVEADRVALRGRRLEHVRDVHRASAGDSLRVGIEGGNIGTGSIESISGEELVMRVELHRRPPAPLPINLILAMPRPKVFNRLLAAVASLGIKQLYLVNAWRVEKSYWKSPRLDQANVRRQLIAGLEQGCDTILPTVHTARFLKQFVDEDLDRIASDTTRIIAHPGGAAIQPNSGAVTAVIGPEGGFIEEEIALFRRHGFQTMSLGARILRVETAVGFLAGRLTTSM
jgi:RsmE family RNA methyltransferase